MQIKNELQSERTVDEKLEAVVDVFILIMFIYFQLSHLNRVNNKGECIKNVLGKVAVGKVTVRISRRRKQWWQTNSEKAYTRRKSKTLVHIKEKKTMQMSRESLRSNFERR